MHPILRLLSVAAVSFAALGPGALAGAAAPGVVVANWQMNESATATTMTDSSGHGITGAIGDLVNPGSGIYRFTYNSGVEPARRLVVVDDDDRLDPGPGYFSVAMRFKTGKGDQNIVQKGQAQAGGGYWKVAMAQGGLIVCHFRDASGTIKAVRPQTPVNNGAWHTVLCERTATGVAMTIDGVRKYSSGALGSVNNSGKLFVGGKLNCDWTTIGCDPFVGTIDYITIRKG